MSKGKNIEYIEEGKRRLKSRKNKRNTKYRELSTKANHLDCSIAGVKGGSWLDSDSPTGYSQICSYFGKCQSPCNGDC